MNVDFSGLDIAFAVVVLLFTLRVGIKGFVKEFMSMAALILGIAIAALFSGFGAQYVRPYIESGPWAQIVAFLILFLITYVIVKLFENALGSIVERINLVSLDRALGFFLGLAEGLLVVFIVILVLQLQPLFETESILQDSVFARVLLPLLPYAQRVLSFGS